MGTAARLEPGDLTAHELLEIVNAVRDAVWPRDDGKYDADRKLRLVEAVLEEYHLKP